MTRESGLPSYRVLSVRTIAVWAVVIVLVGVGMAVWLLLAYTGGNAEANRVQLDAIRTAGTIVVGTGGAVALLLAARRQRSTEIALRQTDSEQVTDLFAKAVEQLGSEKAPVRFGGLYALERLAQDRVEQRQTIVNVLCAYLRMPYIVPGAPPADDASEQDRNEYRDQVQEREVRLAAQRLLTDHLRPGDTPGRQAATFWADIDLDLTAATLIAFDLTDCRLRNARFTHATFTDHTDFGRATFAADASFNMAVFAGDAQFKMAVFAGDAQFNMAMFASGARFNMAEFASGAQFNMAVFAVGAHFLRAVFAGDASFLGVKFAVGAHFLRAVFAGDASFNEAEFGGDAAFHWVKFAGDASFNTAVFAGDAVFLRVEFAGGARFDRVRFARGTPPEVAGFVTPLAGDDVEASDSPDI